VSHPADVDDLDLPVAQFAFPGPLRDRLVEAVVIGRKVSTTALAREYEIEGESLPVVGQRFVVVDSFERRVAVIEVTSVAVVRLGDVDLAHALDEGEGFTTVGEWRDGHEAFWHGVEVREALGEPDFVVDDETRVVLERFKLVERRPAVARPPSPS